MAERIGQILIRKGKISPAQLREALRTQQFFGGYLGSHLINLGFIDEPTLGETLSEIYRVPYAAFETIRLVRAEVLARVPAALAQRFRVVPIQIDGSRLHLAMLNPKDAIAINEISAATSLNVTPWIAPEFRIIQALEKHYKLRRESRASISMRGRLDLSPAPEAHKAATLPEKSADPDPGFGLDGQPLSAPSLPDVLPPASQGEGPRPTDSPRSLAEWLDEEEPPLESSTARSEPSDRRALSRGSSPAPRFPQTQGSRPEARPADSRVVSLDQLSEAISSASSRDEMAREVVAYLGRKFKRAATFAIRQDQAVGWLGLGRGFEPERLQKIAVPLDRPSVFSPVQASQTVYVGPVVQSPESRDLFTYLGGSFPPTVLLVPVTIRDRLVTVLYADNESEPLGPIDLATWKRVARMMGMSLEILILRNKMRQV